MVGKAKMSVTAVHIDRVQTVHDTNIIIGHNFDFKAVLNVSKRRAGALSGEGIDCPDLQWKENIEWFEQRPAGTWRFVSGVSEDMYKEKSDSNTFRPWQGARYALASEPKLNDPPDGDVVEVVRKGGDKAAKHWIAENGLKWTTLVATDTPLLGLGEGGASPVTSNTRRRVIYFDLGFTGNGPRASATQILESVDGQPTIIKFFHPGIPKTRVDDINELARWRDELRHDSRGTSLDGQ